MSDLQAVNSVFNIEIEKIDPNPDQPRQNYSEEALRDLGESIRRYGVMQPITVVRREHPTPSGGIATRYEIVAGERRWRASILAGMATIPAIIREEEETEQERFELSVLENLQREDLNPVDRARSFQRLVEEFGLRHAEIADRLGKSREYVTNSMRLLELPDNILDALAAGEINEGHTRPMLAIRDHPEELQVLFQEIKTKKLTVRQAESTAKTLIGKGPRARRTSAHTTPTPIDPEIAALQAQLSDTLGTAVSIDTKDDGGKLTIDFFSRDDLKKLLNLVEHREPSQSQQANTPTQVQEKPSTSQEAPVEEEDDFVITHQKQHAAFREPVQPLHASAEEQPGRQEDVQDSRYANFTVDDSHVRNNGEGQDIFQKAPLDSVQSIDLDSQSTPETQTAKQVSDNQAQEEVQTNPIQTPNVAANPRPVESPVEESFTPNKAEQQEPKEFASQSVSGQTQPSQTEPRQEQSIPDTGRVMSQPISDLSDEFVPPAEDASGSTNLDSELQSSGADFLPEENKPEGSSATPETQDGSAPLARDVQITMGGMTDHLGITPNKNVARNEEQAPMNNSPASFRDKQQSAPAQQNPQQTNTDPYRLDNFSL